MRIIILGCGRLGSRVANLLDAAGHQVVVLDRHAEAFEQLRRGFQGEKIVGLAHDRHALEQAGVERADALLAATRVDNRNIVAALVARQRFRVPKVVARIYDPDRAEIYRKQGILTVSPVDWAANRIRDLLVHPTVEIEQEFDAGEVVLVRMKAPPRLYGKCVADMTVAGDIAVVVISRGTQAILPTLGMRFQQNDVIRFAVARQAYSRFESLTGLRE